MTVEIVEVSSCKRNLAVEVPAQEVDEEVENLAREYARNVKIPGFRPGKVPMSVIRQRFGSELMKDASQKIIERCWKDALAEHDLKPLAPPVVKDVESKPGSPLKFTVTFEVLPSLEVKDYKGVTLTVPSPEVKDEHVGQALENLREQHAQFVPVDGAEACDGHYVTVNVDGQFEGETKPTHEEDVTLIIGHAQTNADFSSNLRGARAGEARTFDVSYPADYHRKRFAGKTVHYTVTVKDIKEKVLAELNDDFAKNLGADFSNLEELRKKLQETIFNQEEKSPQTHNRKDIGSKHDKQVL